MKYTELIAKRLQLVTDLETVISEPKEAKRSLSKFEDVEVLRLQKEIDALDVEINAKRSENKNNNTNKTQNTMEQFNILKAISDYVDGKSFDDTTIAMIEEGKRSFSDAKLSAKGQLVIPFSRAALASGTATGGQELVPEDKWNMVEPLRNNLVVAKAGARIVTGLSGDVSIPKYAGSQVGWALENGNAADGAGATSEITMQPKRLTAYIDVSKTLLAQTSYDAQQFLIDDIQNAIAAKLDASIISAFSGSTTQPKGVFEGVSTASGATTYATVVGLEGSIDTQNALQGKLAYITHPATKSTLKTTAKLTNGTAIMEGETANGYPVYVSSAVPAGTGPSHGIVFANWNDLVIGQWGGLDIVIDPYTQAVAGKVRLIVNTNFNWVKVRTESFAAKYIG